MYYNYIGTWYQGIHSILQNCAISPYDYVIAILGAKYRVLITYFTIVKRVINVQDWNMMMPK